MQSEKGDPLDWTIDEMVDFLCHSPKTPWSQSTSQAPRPDPVSLEATLRDNFITGEVFLHDVDRETLRQDLGLKALGHVSSMLMAKRYLQRNSPKFQRTGMHLGSLEDCRSIFTPGPFASVTPGGCTQLSSPVYYHSNPAHADKTLRHGIVQNSNPGTPSRAAHSTKNDPGSSLSHTQSGKGRNEASPLAKESVEDSLENSLRDTPHAPNLEEHVNSIDSNKRPRPHEQTIIDDRGKRRRRLDLSTLAQAQVDNLASQSAHGPRAQDWYMGPEQITHSQVFYSSDTDDSDQSFVIVGSKFPTAQRSFVNKSLSHFYKQRPIKLSSEESFSQTAIVPYHPTVDSKGTQGFFTLYTSQNGGVIVSKESLQHWPQLREQLAHSQTSLLFQTTDPADALSSYILEKYPVQNDDQDLCPLYGDSGSEGEMDEETWNEIQFEQQEPNPQESEFKDIDSVIMNCKSTYAKKWCQNCLPKEKHKARKLWLSARKYHNTARSIKNSEREITLLEKRLQKHEEAIRESRYSSKAELETQCQSLEHTVMDIQKHEWRISVLRQKQCPEKVAAVPRRLSTQKRNQNVDDEESLHSESDNMSSDSLDDFIDRSDIATHINTPHTPSSTDSDDDDIISPSGNRRKLRKLPFRQSSSPAPTPNHKIPEECIDLTQDSPTSDDLMIETPPLNPQRVVSQPLEDDPFMSRDSLSVSPGPDIGSSVFEPSAKKQTTSRAIEEKKAPRLPENDDVDSLLLVPWKEIEKRQDRRWLLAKSIASLSDDERNRMIKSIPKYEVQDIQKLTGHALESLLGKQEKIPGMHPSESELIMRTASLYISWVNCVHTQVRGIIKNHVLKAQSEIKEFPAFLQALRNRLNHFSSGGQNRPPGASQEVQPANTPHKKRKREVKQSQDVKRNQESAQMRVALNEQQRKRVEQKIQSMGLSNTDPTHQAVSFGNPVIYLDSHIGKRVKPHQLGGIRFMWRELVETENQQGCLLAHTMGLGKTMQVISLLATISAAASSKDPKIQQQIPESLKRSQTLIICPSSLIENWYEEIIMWDPQNSGLGMARQVTSSSPVQERLQTVSDWDDEGGILIMSYEMFRSWVVNKKTFKRERAPLCDEDHENVRRWLLQGPNIIVADEAHKMKNAATGISQAAMQFRSKSRIALTGSPLANNLTDYYTMVNWIADGYLGHFVEFKANYVEPIEEGLYADSTHTERRKSLMRLQVLKTILDPKISRADISVLAGSLPPKVEFVLTIPLTDIQKAAYDSYVETVLHGNGDVANARLWSWIAILGLCCNHPTCFMDKLLSRANDTQKLNKRLDDVVEVPGDETIAQAGIPHSERLILEQQQLFSTIPNMKALELSYRTILLDKIVDESIKAGDKVLIFSHRLATLDYVEYILKSSKRRYRRLDGQTPMAGRQAATKQFNNGSDEQVYLISIRAGGLGLNIPGANRVIIFDFSFNPVWEEQAVGRAYRLGQQKPVFVYRFIAGGTYEEIMYNKAVFKTQLAFRVVDKKNPIRWATKSLKEYLFPAKPVPQKDISEYIGKDPHVLDKIIKQDDPDDRSICKIALTETFQREDNDKLTDDERKGVQQQLDDERLKRSDPEAYNRRILERQRALMAQNSLNQPNVGHPGQAAQLHPPMDSMQQQQYGHQFNPPMIPSSAHNTGPPALAPDMSFFSSHQSDVEYNTTAPATHLDHPSRYVQSEPPDGNAIMPMNSPSAYQPVASNPFSTESDPAPPDTDQSGIGPGRVQSVPLQSSPDPPKSNCRTQ